jgi:hypothetical protein
MAEITVTAKVTYTYDTDDGLVTDVDSALDDVTSMIDNCEVSAQDFEFQTEVQGTLPDPDEDEEEDI